MKMFIVAMVFGTTLFAAGDIDETAGAWNGRAWNKMNTVMKVAYLRGDSESDGLCQLTANAHSRWPAPLTFGEIAKAVDLFYTEPTKAPVPVVFGALAYVKRKADGANESELNRLAAELRRRSR